MDTRHLHSALHSQPLLATGILVPDAETLERQLHAARDIRDNFPKFLGEDG